MIRGHGCPRCVGHEKLDFVRFKREFSRNQDYIEILGEGITDTKTMFKCKCKRCGNVWQTNVNRLRQGNGCNLCNHSSTSFMEQAILKAFKERLGDKNVLSRDKSLIGKELDVYIPSKKLAIEPGGWFFHKKTKKRDLLKRQLCKEKGVRLVTIYDCYTEESSPFKEDCFVFNEELGAPKSRILLKNLIDELFKISDISPCLSHDEWEKIQEYANEKSMQKSSVEIIKEIEALNPSIIILKKPTRSHEKVLCECKRCGWKWETTPAKLKMGIGCPDCGGTRKLTQEEFKEQLKVLNPDVSTNEEYKNMNTPMMFQCNICGYMWKIKPRAMIRNGSMCPLCRKKNDLKQVLENRGVEVTESDREDLIRFARNNPNKQYNTEEFKWLISKTNPEVEVLGKYTKISDNITCKCQRCGNIWNPRAQHILNGHGCPLCNKIIGRKDVYRN